MASGKARGNTFTVTNTADAGSGSGSFRQAILNANANLGTHYIKVAIPSSAELVVNLQSLLPPITEKVIINGKNVIGAYQKIVLEGSYGPVSSSFDCLEYLKVADPQGRTAEPTSTLPMLSVMGSGAKGGMIINMTFRNTVADASLIDATNADLSGDRHPTVAEVATLPAGTIVGPCEGLKIDGADYVSVINSSFSGFLLGNAALNMPNSNNSLILNNTTSNQNDGLEVNDGVNNLFINNTLVGNGMLGSNGLHIVPNPGNIILGNHIDGTDRGITLTAATINGLPGTLVYNNDISNASNHGVNPPSSISLNLLLSL